MENLKEKAKKVAEKIAGGACIIIGLMIGAYGVHCVRPKKKYAKADLNPRSYTSLNNSEE